MVMKLIHDGYEIHKHGREIQKDSVIVIHVMIEHKYHDIIATFPGVATLVQTSAR